MARPEAVGEDFNIGNPINTVTVYQLAHKVRELTKARVPIMFVDPGFADIGVRVPSLEKARKTLGYVPKYPLDDGLVITVDWYRRHLEVLNSRLKLTAAMSA